MKFSLLKSTALAAVLAAGFTTGAIAAGGTGSTPGAEITSMDLIQDRVVTADQEPLGTVINVYQAPETADPFIIVDRGATYAAESRFVPIRRDNIQMLDDQTLVVKTTRAEFDTAPAFDEAGINDVNMWPPRIEEFWEDKYAADEPVPFTVSGAVNVRPNDLSKQNPGYQQPGAQPSPGAGAGEGAGAVSPGGAAASGGTGAGGTTGGSGVGGTQ